MLQSTGKKKKKGLLGKLKKLTKSRSIDDGVSDFTTGMSQVIMNCKFLCYYLGNEHDNESKTVFCRILISNGNLISMVKLCVNY